MNRYNSRGYCRNNRNNNEKNCKKTDFGASPYVVNIASVVSQNNAFRSTLWTGECLQMAIMCIPVGCEIGAEIHPRTDQYLFIQEGQGMVKMGSCENSITLEQCVSCGCGIFVPAGTWHNLLNTGECPLKLLSIYAPPEHEFGTVQQNPPCE